jgi:hypothetical protein
LLKPLHGKMRTANACRFHAHAAPSSRACLQPLTDLADLLLLLHGSGQKHKCLIWSSTWLIGLTQRAKFQAFHQSWCTTCLQGLLTPRADATCAGLVLLPCSLMQDGFASAALALLQHIGITKAAQHNTPAVATAAAAAAASAAGSLRACTTADDERPPASKAFLHARQLAGTPHNALQVLLPVLQQLQACKPLPVGPLTSVMAAVRQVRAQLLEPARSVHCQPIRYNHLHACCLGCWSSPVVSSMRDACVTASVNDDYSSRETT